MPYRNPTVPHKQTCTRPFTIFNGLPEAYAMLPNRMEALLASLSINFWRLTALTPRCAWTNIEWCCACWHCNNKAAFCERSSCTSATAAARSSRRTRTSFFSASLRSKERCALSFRPSSLAYGTYRQQVLHHSLGSIGMPRTTSARYTVLRWDKLLRSSTHLHSCRHLVSLEQLHASGNPDLTDQCFVRTGTTTKL